MPFIHQRRRMVNPDTGVIVTLDRTEREDQILSGRLIWNGHTISYKALPIYDPPAYPAFEVLWRVISLGRDSFNQVEADILLLSSAEKNVAIDLIGEALKGYEASAGRNVAYVKIESSSLEP